MNVLGIATININGITSPTRVDMLAEFIRKQNLDIVFLQEVTSPDIRSITGYETHMNIGATMRGTAILAKSQHQLTNILIIPSGRAIAAKLQGIYLINIYAPSGTARRA
jgi:exonuclease III